MEEMEEFEEWRPINGWEGYYSISNRGRVRSERRKIMRSNGVPQSAGGIILRQRTEAKGHRAVTFIRDGKVSIKKVHLLVLEAFVGARPPGMEGCHYDDDKSNNTVENLRWDTRSANRYDRIRNGRDHNLNKTHCPQGHPYDEANTIVYVRPDRSQKPDRRCRTCVNAYMRGLRARKKAAA